MNVRVLNVHGDELTAELVVFVELSERNVRDLLAQFEDDRLIGTAPYADLRRRCDDISLHVAVLSNEAHYGDRVAGPGSGLVDA